MSAFVRPIEARDLDGLVELASIAGVGLTTLPPQRDALEERISASSAAFAGGPSKPGEMFTFVLEDAASGRVAGVCAIATAVGLIDPWYAYRVGLVVHASRELGIYTRTPTLFLTNDLTGQSELCTLLLHPDFRHSRNGSLLSRSRLLFIAAHRARFGERLIAELRGVSDAAGRSPFWDALGRYFFSMEFSQADYLTGIGRKAFVAELMPKHPLYTSFLAEAAQAVIGVAHAQTQPARKLLEAEGLRFEGHVDIFDAGPVVECGIDDIGAVRACRRFEAREGTPSGTTPWLVANPAYAQFRATLLEGGPEGETFHLPAATLTALGLKQGGPVLAVALSPADRHG